MMNLEAWYALKSLSKYVNQQNLNGLVTLNPVALNVLLVKKERFHLLRTS